MARPRPLTVERRDVTPVALIVAGQVGVRPRVSLLMWCFRRRRPEDGAVCP